jgi:CRISPR-associated protein Csb2
LRTEFEQMAVFRKKAGPGLPIEATLTLTDAVRRALMSNAGNGGPMTDLIHGHNSETHCAVVGLPFVGREHADGHLMGFAVIFPRATDARERVQVLRACKALEEHGVNIPRVGDWEVEVEEEAALNQSLRAATWTSPSRVWQTVTPILLDRFPKKKGPGVEEILAASCRRIGLPDPVGIEHGPYSAVDGVPPVPAFRLQRADEKRARWGVHAKLQFAAAVRGPMVLGAGRYFGLGFMRPEREKKLDGRD